MNHGCTNLLHKILYNSGDNAFLNTCFLRNLLNNFSLCHSSYVLRLFILCNEVCKHSFQFILIKSIAIDNNLLINDINRQSTTSYSVFILSDIKGRRICKNSMSQNLFRL